MTCARGDCGLRADVVVDFGAGLLALLCAQDAVRALVDSRDRRIVRRLGVIRSDDPPETGVTG